MWTKLLFETERGFIEYQCAFSICHNIQIETEISMPRYNVMVDCKPHNWFATTMAMMLLTHSEDISNNASQILKQIYHN